MAASYTGTVETTWNTDGITQSTSTLTDAYHQVVLASSTADGTYKQTSTAGGTYDNSETSLQTYADGVLTGDTLDYSYTSTGDVSVTTSNYANYSATAILSQAGLEFGTTTGVLYVATGSSLHSQSTDAGTQDFTNDTGSFDSSSSYHGSSWFLAFGNSQTAFDGGSTASAANFAFSSASASGSSSVEGPYHSLNNPSMTGGSSHDQSQSQDSGKAVGWTKLTLNNGLTNSSSSSLTSASSDQAIVDLTYDPDGKAEGSVLGYSDGSATADTTVTWTGTRTLLNALGSAAGTRSYNNKSHSTVASSYAIDTILSLADDQASGTVTATAHNSASVNNSTNETIDLNNGVLHANVISWVNGTTQTTNTVIATLSDGQSSATRTLDIKQVGTSGGTQVANGKLWDDAGHTGKWDLNAKTSGSVKDHITAYFTWTNEAWQKTGADLDIDERGSSLVKYHQDDNGLCDPADTATFTSTRYHELNTTDYSSSSVIENGTSASYTYDTKNESYHFRGELRHGTTWCALPGGGTETVTYYTDQRSRSSVDDVRKGTVMGTAVVPTQIHIKTESSTSYESHNTTDSPTSWYEWHTKSWSNVETLRELSLAASYIKGSSYSASAWKMIDKVSGATSSNVTDPPITTWQIPWGGPDWAPWWSGAGAIGTAALSGYFDALFIFGNPVRAWETGSLLYLIPGVSSTVSAIDSFQGYLSVGADPFMAGALTVASNLPLANSALSIIEMYNGISLRGTDFGRQLTTFDVTVHAPASSCGAF